MKKSDFDKIWYNSVATMDADMRNKVTQLHEQSESMVESGKLTLANTVPEAVYYSYELQRKILYDLLSELLITDNK